MAAAPPVNELRRRKMKLGAHPRQQKPMVRQLRPEALRPRHQGGVFGAAILSRALLAVGQGLGGRNM